MRSMPRRPAPVNVPAPVKVPDTVPVLEKGKIEPDRAANPQRDLQLAAVAAIGTAVSPLCRTACSNRGPPFGPVSRGLVAYGAQPPKSTLWSRVERALEV